MRNFCFASVLVYIPYVPPKGSLKIPIWGVAKVKMTKSRAIAQSIPIANFGNLQFVFSFLNSFVS